MPIFLALSALASAVMAVGVLRILRPASPGAAIGRALLATGCASLAAAGLGALTGAEDAGFLLATGFAAAPVALLLGAAAEESAPGRRRVAWTLVLSWAVVVFPASSVLPPLLLGLCDAPECRVEDFGAGLPLLVSAAASALLAWRVRERPPNESGWVGFALPVLVLWAGAVLWLVSLEGALDAYTGRILLSAVLAPLGGGAAWLLVDLLRQAPRHPIRSFADGLVAGIVAILPGAASLSFPWSVVVGVLAGAAAAAVYGARRLSAAGGAGHWALVVLTSTAIGYLAPAVTGDTIGLVFSGRIGALVPALLVFLAVVVFGVVASAPAWMLRRR